MGACISFLRGINVGGKGALPMKDLVAALEAVGARRVRTYIQSGNAAFESGEADLERLARQIAAGILERRGFEPHVQVLARDALARAIAGNPFPDAVGDPGSLHLGFLAASPQRPDLDRLASLRKDSERFVLSERVFYLHAPEGVGRSKLAASAERLLGVPMTDRNWRTVCKVMELASA